MSLPESMGTRGVPYPPERYHGESGEVSAYHRPDATAPDLSYPNGVKVDYGPDDMAEFYKLHDNYWVD